MFRIAAGLILALVPLAVGQPAATQSTTLPAGLAPALACVPEDAHLLVVIPSIKAFAGGVAEFGKVIGVADLAEQVFGSELGFDPAGNRITFGGARIDAGGPLVVALSAEIDEPLLIARVDRPESWTATSRPARADGVPVYELGGRCFAAATVEDIGIFVRDESDLQRALKARQAAPAALARAAAGALGERQLLIYIDVPAWTDTVQTQLTVVAQAMLMGMTATATTGGDADTVMQIWNWVLDRARRLVGDTQSLALGVRIDRERLLLDMHAALKPGSDTARHLGQVRRPGRELLRGLPDHRGALVFAYEWEDPPGTESLNESMMRSLLKVESLRERVGSERLESVIKMSCDLGRHVPGGSAVVDFNVEGGGLVYWGLYLGAGGPGMQQAFRELCEKAPDLYSTWGNIPARIEIRPPETVAGVTADVYRFVVTDDEPMMQPVMQAIYGPEPALYLAPHPVGTAYAFGPRAVARDRLAALLEGGTQGLKDARVTAVLQRLSPNPQLTALVDLPAAVGGLMNMVQQMGLPVPRLPARPDSDAPLTGLNLYLDPQGIRAELYLPADALRPLIKAAESLAGPGSSAS